MIKIRQATSMRDQAFAAVEYVDAHARGVLENGGAPIAETDVSLLESVQSGLAGDLHELDQLFALTLTTKAAETAFQIVSKLVLRSHIIGAAAIHTPEAEDWRNAVRTMQMRLKRDRKPDRMALRQAVRAEHGDGPVKKPSKEAGAILSAVNKRLEDSGYQGVKLDVVRRELQKFPRS